MSLRLRDAGRETGPRHRVRPATQADMAAIRAIAGRYETLASWPQPPDYLDLERTAGRLLVGERRGTVVGYGGTLSRGGLVHLADLFVHPDHQSAGLGVALLDELLPHAAPVVTFASADPRAVGLYTRRGLRPVTPMLYLTGRVGGLPAAAGTARVTTAERVAGLDTSVSGGERHGHLTWYASLPTVSVHSTDGAYAFARTVGDDLVVGPAGGRTPADCADAVLAALADHPEASRAHVAVFGPHPLLGLLLSAGFAITDMDTYMEREPDSIAVDRYVPHVELG